MLKLFTFGPYFDMPDASPFCIKALLLLKMSGLVHDVQKMDFRKAPKGKAPYLQDGEQLVADSYFIQNHLEKHHGVDFSGGYSAADIAKGTAVARMLEEHLYFMLMQSRWFDADNFERGPAKYFDEAPALIRPIIRFVVRSKIRKTLKLQGIGLHTSEERLSMGKSDVDCVETLLGKNAYFLGNRPSGIDASIAGFLWSVSSPHFVCPLSDYVRSRPAIMAYLTRMVGDYFPEYKV